MKKLIVPVVLAAVLIGCGSTTPQTKIKWVSWNKVDEFTDKTTCRATVGSYYRNDSVYTYSGNLYPFIEKVGDEVIVGVTSGGRVTMPVGDVQIRIDDNKAWDISTSETPVDSSDLPKYMQAAQIDSSVYTQHLTDEQKKHVESVMKSSLDSNAKLVSHYTAATGDKAQKIIIEMLQGLQIKYRTKGFTGVPSTTGVYQLDTSLIKAIQECGMKITPEGVI